MVGRFRFTQEHWDLPSHHSHVAQLWSLGCYMTVSLSSDDIDAAVRHDAAISWGWPLFLSGSLGWAIISYLLYWWVAYVSVGMFRFLADGFLCATLCLISCIGFIQVVSGTPCNRLHKVWQSLALWRRLLILSFVMGAILVLVPFTYFLFFMSPRLPINGEI